MFKPTVSEKYGVNALTQIDIDEPLPPLFLHPNLEQQNTMNLAYWALNSTTRTADAAALFYKVLSGIPHIKSEYITGRYEFKNVLFDTALNWLDQYPHRFAQNGENEVLFNGRKCILCKVQYSRVDTAKVIFTSPLTNGHVTDMNEVADLDESFGKTFHPLDCSDVVEEGKTFTWEEKKRLALKFMLSI